MTPASGSAAPQWRLAIEAAALLAVDPAGLGGVRVHARATPARDAWLTAAKASFPGAPVRRLPNGISDDRLQGGLDLAATLKAGRPIADRGLLAECDGGVLLIPSAERLTPALVARIAQVMDRGATQTERDGFTISAATRFTVIALDEHLDGEDAPPGALLDRLALSVSLDGLSLRDIGGEPYTADAIAAARARLPQVTASDEAVAAIVEACNALAITSARSPLFALRAARAKAALDGRDHVDADDLALAASLVLAPHARALPEAPPPPEQQPEEQQSNTEQPAPESDDTPTPEELAEMILAATRAALPPDILARLKIENAKRDRQQREGRAGAEGITKGRGRPAGTRAGKPERGARLNVLETLRAAAPWQRLRGVGPGSAPTGTKRRIEVRLEDFRITRTKKKNTTATIFVVDASGSSALHRLAEAKGAVEILLADCYMRRDEVAVIAFRGKTADILLEPTRSLARAKRSLAALPGGGGTPMAAAIERAHAAGLAARRKGHTPTIVFLTDGRANIDRAGRAGRRAAAEDAATAAKRFAADGLSSLVIDTSVKRAPEAESLARALSALYLALPHASAATVSDAVRRARA